MGRKIPKHIHVRLKQSEIYAHRIDIRDLAEFTLLNHVADRLCRAGEKEGVIDHKDSVFTHSEIDEVLSLLGRGR